MAPVHRPSDRSSASIYALMDPDTHAVVYVGVTRGPLAARLRQHIYDRYAALKAHYPLYCWIRALVDEQGRWPTIACLGLYPQHMAAYAELAWFRFYLRRGAGLLNTFAPLQSSPARASRGRLSPAEAGRLLQHGHGVWCPDTCLCWAWAWDCCLGCGEKPCLRLPRCGSREAIHLRRITAFHLAVEERHNASTTRACVDAASILATCTSQPAAPPPL